MRQLITTPDEFIDRLGGTAKVAEGLGYSQSRVANWRQRGLPRNAEFFFAAERLAGEAGFTLDPALFGVSRAAS